MSRKCGYQGSNHYCTEGRVEFISRYHDENDYCVGGHRITVYDDGRASYDATPEELNLISLHELNAYATYLHWHAERKLEYGPAWPEIEPYKGLCA